MQEHSTYGVFLKRGVKKLGRLVKWYHKGLQIPYCWFDSNIARSRTMLYW